MKRIIFGSRRRRGCLTLGAVAVGAIVGCDTAAQRSRPEIPLPDSSFAAFELKGDGKGPSVPGFLVRSGPTEFVLYDASDPALWHLTLEPKPELGLLRKFEQDPDFRVTGMAISGEAIALIVGNIQLWILDRETGEDLHRKRLDFLPGTQVLEMASVADTAWVVFLRGFRRASPELVTPQTGLAWVPMQPDALLQLLKIDGLHSRESWLQDYTSFGRLADTFFIAGTAPPRVTRIHSLGGSKFDSATVRFRGAPTRMIPQSEVQEIRDALRGSGMGEAPTHYPPIAGLLPIENGYIARSGVSSDAFGLDLYCGGAYRKTLYENPENVNILFGDGVIGVVEMEGASVWLRLYRPGAIGAVCDG